MVTLEDLMHKCTTIESLLKAHAVLGQDAINFIGDKGLWVKFVEYHNEQERWRESNKVS
jgi:hypothetical protein